MQGCVRSIAVQTHAPWPVYVRCTNEMKYYVYVTSVHWPAGKHTGTMTAAELKLPAGRVFAKVIVVFDPQRTIACNTFAV